MSIVERIRIPRIESPSETTVGEITVLDEDWPKFPVEATLTSQVDSFFDLPQFTTPILIGDSEV